MERPLFTTKKSQDLISLSVQEKQQAFKVLGGAYGISDTQIAEMSGTGLAMVSRFALGNTASAGEVLGIISDSLAGLCALSGLRHLRAAGSRVHILALGKMESSAAKALLTPLEALAVAVEYLDPEVLSENEFHDYFAELCQAHHCCIQGIFSWPNPDWAKTFVQLMNDQSIPTHCLEYPLGLDPDTGQSLGEAQFASSTLALGFPYTGSAKAAEHLGRTYVTDVHLTRELIGQVLSQDEESFPESVFTEQPVVQIFPK